MADDPQNPPPTLEQRLGGLAARLEAALGTSTSTTAPAVAQAPAATAAPVAAPAGGIDYDQLAAAMLKVQQANAPAPAAAPSAPSAHALPTANGVVDLFNLQPGQIQALGAAGVRENLDKLWAMGNQMSGAPARPVPPATRVDVIERIKR